MKFIISQVKATLCAVHGVLNHKDRPGIQCGKPSRTVFLCLPYGKPTMPKPSNESRNLDGIWPYNRTPHFHHIRRCTHDDMTGDVANSRGKPGRQFEVII